LINFEGGWRMGAEAIFLGGRDQIIDDAAETLRTTPTHYAASGPEMTKDRLRVLFDVVVVGIADRELGPVLAYAKDLARQRFSAGFGVGEVQTAFNALEEAAWRYVVANCKGQELVDAVAALGTVLGAGKDELAREYVSLASNKHVPSLDLSALFGGAAPGITPQQGVED
jgi:hypothetical protein